MNDIVSSSFESYIYCSVYFGKTTLRPCSQGICFPCILRPCPHDTFPNWARSIATSSRPVSRVHTGATETLVPDHLLTWNDWARSIAIGRAQSTLSCGRSCGRWGSARQITRCYHRPHWPISSPNIKAHNALSHVFNSLRKHDDTYPGWNE